MRPFGPGQAFPPQQIATYPIAFGGFDNPTASATEGFEFADGWSGTIANANYPETFTGFDTPTASEVDGFEFADGWPGTA